MMFSTTLYGSKRRLQDSFAILTLLLLEFACIIYGLASADEVSEFSSRDVVTALRQNRTMQSAVLWPKPVWNGVDEDDGGRGQLDDTDDVDCPPTSVRRINDFQVSVGPVPHTLSQVHVRHNLKVSTW